MIHYCAKVQKTHSISTNITLAFRCLRPHCANFRQLGQLLMKIDLVKLTNLEKKEKLVKRTNSEKKEKFIFIKRKRNFVIKR